MKRKSKVTKRFKEEMMQVLTISLSITALLMSVATFVVISVMQNNLKKLEAESNITLEYVTIERIPVKEQFARYIDSLPVPETEFSQLPEKEPEEILIVKKQEEIHIINKTDNIESEYDLSDKELLAQLMYAEEGIFFKQYEENPQEVELVHKLAGSVALHRFENHYKGAKSLTDVLYAKNQYDMQTIQRVEQGQEMPDVVYTWAEDLLRNGPIGPENLIFQSEFKQGSDVYKHIGNQYFCLQ